MNKNTLKAIARRIKNGETAFKIGAYTYHVNNDRKTVIHYFGGNPQITYFSELPQEV